MSVFRSERHSGESRPASTAAGTRPTTALVVTMNATGISPATSCSSAPAAPSQPPRGRTRTTASRNPSRSRTAQELLVHRADRRRVGLRPTVIAEQAVLLLLDVGELRPAEAGDVVGDLVDDLAVRVREIVDMAVDEVSRSHRKASELADPERDVVAPLLDVLRQLARVVVHVDEVRVVELLPAACVDHESRPISRTRLSRKSALEILRRLTPVLVDRDPHD